MRQAEKESVRKYEEIGVGKRRKEWRRERR